MNIDWFWWCVQAFVYRMVDHVEDTSEDGRQESRGGEGDGVGGTRDGGVMVEEQRQECRSRGGVDLLGGVRLEGKSWCSKMY